MIVELKTELKKSKELKVEMEGKFLVQQSEIQRLTMKCQEYENLIKENRTEIEKLRKEAEEKKQKQDNSGVLEIVRDEKGVEWLLYLNLIEGEEDPHSLALQERINPSRAKPH